MFSAGSFGVFLRFVSLRSFCRERHGCGARSRSLPRVCVGNAAVRAWATLTRAALSCCCRSSDLDVQNLEVAAPAWVLDGSSKLRCMRATGVQVARGGPVSTRAQAAFEYARVFHAGSAPEPPPGRESSGRRCRRLESSRKDNFRGRSNSSNNRGVERRPRTGLRSESIETDAAHEIFPQTTAAGCTDAAQGAPAMCTNAAQAHHAWLPSFRQPRR